MNFRRQFDNQSLSLIQYLGNDLKAVDYLHGNSKAEGTKPYIRTLPFGD